MQEYHNVDEIFKDRRKGVPLSKVVDTFLQSPHIMAQFETPFDIVEDLYPFDYLDASSMSWQSLSTQQQIRYSTAYQQWYSIKSKNDPVKIHFKLNNTQSTEMMLIPPMRYKMSTPETDSAKDEDDLFKLITVRRPSWVSRFPVKTNEWSTGVPSSETSDYHRIIQNRPITHVDWNSCLKFCNKIGLQPVPDCLWEMACRAGTTSRYYFGDDPKQLDLYAWHEKNSNQSHQVVGRKLPNAWGLYDMLGNVAEWCLGPFVHKKPNLNPHLHVLRGGSFDNNHLDCRSSFRDWGSRAYSDHTTGFRMWLNPFRKQKL